MNTWAIIKTGGKQFKVSEGETIAVEKISLKGDSVSFDEILLIKDDKTLHMGKPYVKGAKVKAKFLGDHKEKKIRVVKFKSKSRYLRTTGHRQTKSKLLIEKISAE